MPFIASHHFHPDVLLLNEKHEHGTYFITKIDVQLARAIGLKDSDRVSRVDSYYAVPNQTIQDATDYISQKEMDSVVGGSDIKLTSRMSSKGKQDMRNMKTAKDVIDSAEKERILKLQERVADEAVIRASLSENQEKLSERSLADMKFKDQEIERLQVELLELRLQSEESGRKLADYTKEAEAIIAKHVERDNSRSGLERGLLLNDTWHASNSTVCIHLFGLHTFDEYKVYCVCLFQGIKLEYGNSKLDNITDWEKISIAKLRMRRGIAIHLLGLIFNRKRTTVGSYVTFGAEKWGEAGENLSILDLTKEYLDHERRQIFTDANHHTVGALVDGKDFMTADPKQNSAIRKAMWSDKINHAGVRICTWSTPSDLTFEHTPAYMARATESAIVALWGSFWEYVPLSKVPDVKSVSMKFVPNEKYAEKCPVLKTIIKEKRNNGTGVDDIDSESDIDAAEVLSDDDVGEEDVCGKRERPSVPVILKGRRFIDMSKLREKKTDSGRKYSTTDITKMNKELLKAGTNESTTKKLEQLIVHEALHEAYSRGDLRKCLLSYYLEFMSDLRTDMMSHLNGDAGDKVPPLLMTRLAKIPPGFTVLADRGFYFDAPSYPNVNAQITPHFLTSREQFESDEISRDLITCRLRWSSEAIFSRVTDHEILTDVIPYSHLSILASAIQWGHAHANLMQPFNSPVTY